MTQSRLIAFYVALLAVTAAVAAVVLSAGSDEHGLQSIAGGYDLTAPSACLGPAPAPAGGRPLPQTAPPQPKVAGPSVDLKQSGEFVNLSNPQETVGGRLRLGGDELRGGARRLTGSVDCTDGSTRELDATATPGSRGVVTGTLGGRPITANLRRDPPDAGTPAPRAPGSIAATYKATPRSTCLGGTFDVEDRGGDAYEVSARGKRLGRIAYDSDKGIVTGDLACTRGGSAKLRALAVDRNLNNVRLIPLDPAAPAPGQEGAARPVLTTPSGLAPAGENFSAAKQRESFGHTVAAFLLAVALVMVAARLFGIAAARLGQPRVMGEVVAGIALGPTLLGWLAPGVQAFFFPTDILPSLGVVANLGLVFYMFLVGLELDPTQLRGRLGQAAAISNTSVALPMILGIAVALPTYEVVGPDKDFVPFALFMGVAMSITAFPVLARILVERRMLGRPVGALALACAAIDDITAWFLIALALAVATAGGAAEVVQTIALAVAFCLFMGAFVRPMLRRLSTAFDEAGRVPGGWIAAIFVGVLLSAYVTEEIGIAVIFGAFVMGLIMPRDAGLTEDVTRRIEDFVVIVLLPLFFAYTGLKTNVGLLDRPVLWLITGVLIVVAIAGKLIGAAVAARITGFGWRASLVIGTLMNTRGLTELIVLNLALEKGVISEALFAMLVLMALVTTFMAGPLLRLLDPRNAYGAPVEEELEEARRRSSIEFPGVPQPDRSILVAPQTDTSLAQLLALAEPLARSEPPRELILSRLVHPPRRAQATGGMQTENRLLRDASNEVNFARLELVDRGVAARAIAFTSATPGRDLSRLAASEEVDLVLIDGRRPLLGGEVPRGDVGAVLNDVECDVAVLVVRESAPVVPSVDAPVLVPFGGAEHDWAALELGAWIAVATGAPLRLLGAADQAEEAQSPTRLLGDAGLLVQQFAGIAIEPVVAEPGRAGIVAAAAGSGLLVVGLSERWRQEGLGATRSEIAKAAPAPVVFVRRGRRPGALAPRADVTRFGWSSAGSPAAGPS